MKKFGLHTLLIVLVFSMLAACRKNISFPYTDQLTDYMQLQVGKYITYRLDSLEFIDFGTIDTVVSYLAKDVIDDSITDNLGRPSWRVIRYLSDTTGSLPWTPAETYMITPTTQTIEVVENNLRYQKLELPVVDGFSWPGNSYIDTRAGFSQFTYLAGWNYTYDSVDMPYTVSDMVIPNSVIVRQRDTTGQNVNLSQSPVAVPGPSRVITLPTSSAVLDGSQSYDPNGFIIGYKWQQIGGPGPAVIADTNAVTTTASALQAGEYLFQLTVTDNDSAVGTGEIKIIVADPGSPLPVANAGVNQSILYPNSSVTLDGSASQAASGNNIVQYQWTQITLGAASITNPNSSITDVTGLQQGVYSFQLQVTDNLGNTSTDNVTVVVSPPTFSQRVFSVEVYAKHIGLIYKNFLFREYQPPNGTNSQGSSTGYGLTLKMVDHN